MNRKKMLLCMLASGLVFMAPGAVCMQKPREKKISVGEVFNYSFNLGAKLLWVGFFKLPGDDAGYKHVFNKALASRLGCINYQLENNKNLTPDDAVAFGKEKQFLKSLNPREFGPKKKTRWGY